MKNLFANLKGKKLFVFLFMILNGVWFVLVSWSIVQDPNNSIFEFTHAGFGRVVVPFGLSISSLIQFVWLRKKKN